MINRNEEDRLEMVNEIKEAIKLGHMISNEDIYNLQLNLEDLGYDYTAEYVSEEPEDALNLIKEALA